MAFGLGGVLMAVVVFLFLIKTTAVYDAFEKDIPKGSYTVRAKVHIDEISDSVYDTAMGTHYRQKATLTDLRLVHNTHKYANSAKSTHNPFDDNDNIPTQNIQLPDTMTVLLTAFAHQKPELSQVSTLTPHTQTTMTLIISPVARQEAGGFDGYRWLRTRHIHANAKILSIDGQTVPTRQAGLEQLRQALRVHFYEHWHSLSNDERQAKAIVLSLLTGDRALIDKSTKELYQFAGISHLLAISGTHVVFLAVMLAWLVVSVVNRVCPVIYQTLSLSTIRWSVMVGASLIYALFTGFDVPAVRTVYMLMALVVVKKLALPISSANVLAVVALVMIWLDPVVVWQAGFWLSFVAVLLLMRYDGQDEWSGNKLTSKQHIIALMKLQGWLFVAMLPISLLLFDKVSLWGVLVNLVAVGLFGMVIVPINLLAGTLFLVLPAMADILWGLLGAILGLLHTLFGWLDGMGNEVWLYQTVGVLGLVLGGLAVLPFVLPMISRKFAIMPLTALVLLGLTTDDEFSVTVLPSSDEAISQILIRQQDGDPDGVDGQATWLVLSDFGGRMTADKLADELLVHLKKHKTRHLTGVVVQTPTPLFGEVISRLQDSLPIYRYWQAGNVQAPSGLAVSPCVAGQRWQSDSLLVYATTGWQDVSDEAVWGCTLVIDSIATPTLKGAILPAQPQHTPSDSHRLVINGASHLRTWQLYAMLCQANQDDKTDLWLTHSKNALDEWTLGHFAPNTIAFSDNNTPKNTQKATALLQEWQP